jgi:hypothetical protein
VLVGACLERGSTSGFGVLGLPWPEDLAGRGGDEVAAARGSRGDRRRDAQAGVRQRGQRDVPVPGIVAAEPVLIEAGFPF